jgi:protein-S-isoprenylcysteine O-methyltransferase Ste14
MITGQRAVPEELMLQQELAGFAPYMTEVKYRLILHIC